MTTDKRARRRDDDDDDDDGGDNDASVGVRDLFVTHVQSSRFTARDASLSRRQLHASTSNTSPPHVSNSTHQHHHHLIITICNVCNSSLLLTALLIFCRSFLARV